MARRAGIAYDLAKRVFRALGFPELPDDAVEFDDRDVDALKVLKTIIDMGFTEDDIITLSRTFGFALSRIADAETRVFRKTFIGRLQEDDVSEATLGARVADAVPVMLELQQELVGYALRRHLLAAIENEVVMDAGGATQVLAAGFIDLVGFTEVSGDLEAAELADLVSRFETLCLETCSDLGVQVVKVIGDAIMFVSSDARAALEAARSIVAQLEEREDLPSGRAGIDIGDVLPVGGDYFGRPVNVAARLQHLARPGTVVASEDVVGTLPDDMDVSHIGKKRLKGLGSVRTFKVKLPRR